MKPEILVVPEMLDPLCAELERDFIVHRLWPLAGPEALGDARERIRGIATNGQCGADSALLAVLPKAEIVSVYGVGVDKVDMGCARSRGIVVTTTPDILTEDVADMAIALMLDCVRDISYGDRYVRAGRWLAGDKHLPPRLGGKKLGILGMGRIGAAVARKAQAFAMPVAYHNRTPRADAPYRYVADPVRLAAESDVLVVTAAATAETRGMVNDAVLDALGPTGFLVNVARGALIDEPALVRALVEGRIAGAGLDVFADEPRVPEALLALDTVVLQPHHGSGTRECRQEMADLVVANLRGHFLEGGAVTPLD